MRRKLTFADISLNIKELNSNEENINNNDITRSFLHSISVNLQVENIRSQDDIQVFLIDLSADKDREQSLLHKSCVDTDSFNQLLRRRSQSNLILPSPMIPFIGGRFASSEVI